MALRVISLRCFPVTATTDFLAPDNRSCRNAFNASARRAGRRQQTRSLLDVERSGRTRIGLEYLSSQKETAPIGI
jgi:hypothetical protein